MTLTKSIITSVTVHFDDTEFPQLFLKDVSFDVEKSRALRFSNESVSSCYFSLEFVIHKNSKISLRMLLDDLISRLKYPSFVGYIGYKKNLIFSHLEFYKILLCFDERLSIQNEEVFISLNKVPNIKVYSFFSYAAGDLFGNQSSNIPAFLKDGSIITNLQIGIDLKKEFTESKKIALSNSSIACLSVHFNGSAFPYLQPKDDIVVVKKGNGIRISSESVFSLYFCLEFRITDYKISLKSVLDALIPKLLVQHKSFIGYIGYIYDKSRFSNARALKIVLCFDKRFSIQNPEVFICFDMVPKLKAYSSLCYAAGDLFGNQVFNLPALIEDNHVITDMGAALGLSKNK